jgi:hypothetical protein
MFLPSFHSQQVVELEGYVIILVEGRDGKIKLYGSPADRDGLEVADEILDVNERKLDDVPRALVIKHIHEVSGWGDLKDGIGKWRSFLMNLWRFAMAIIQLKYHHEALNSSFRCPPSIENQSQTSTTSHSF